MSDITGHTDNTNVTGSLHFHYDECHNNGIEETDAAHYVRYII